MAASLATLRTSAKSRADMVNSAFVTDPEWNTWIQAAYAELWDLLVAAWEDYFLLSSNITLISGTDRYSLAAIAPKVYKIRGVDLLQSGSAGNYLPLHRFEWADRGRYVNAFATAALVAAGQYLRYTLQANSIVFAPVPDAAYTIRLWYVPQVNQLVIDGDTLDATIPDGYEDYVVLGAAIRALKKEESDPAALMLEQKAVEDRIEAMAPNRDALEPIKMGGRTDSLALIDPSLRRNY